MSTTGPTIIFHGQVIDNKLSLWRAADFERYVKALNGKRIELVLRRHKTQRSSNQNRYFHGVVCKLISEDTGYEVEEVKEILRQKFLLIDEGGFSRCRSTTSLDTAEMAEFTDKCRRWAATQLGVDIPDPGQVA